MYNEGSESEKILALSKEAKPMLKFTDGACNVALCVEGTQLDSIGFSQFLQERSLAGESKINFFIGGAFGLSDEIKDRCVFKLSLSKMTLPHEFARIFLLEQIYRAFTIMKGTKYHK